MKTNKKIFFTIFFAVIAAGVSAAGLVLAETQSGSLDIGVTIGGSVCGNGTVESGETCDDGGSNGACPATCSASCTTNSCGGGGSGPVVPPVDNSPTITNVTTTAITVNSATVSWNASDDIGISASTFVYGLTTAYGSSGSVGGAYSVSLSGLSANTVYYYKISVTDTASHTVVSTGSFATLSVVGDVTPPIISNIQIVTGTTAATITFDTNELATVQVNYGPTASYGSTVLGGSAAVTHSLVIPGLYPNTSYHYRLVADDLAVPSNSANTPDTAFTTLLPNPPANVGSFTLTPSFAAITLGWNIAGISYYDHIKLLRKSNTTTSASGPNDPNTTVLLNTAAIQYIDTDIVPGTDYSYTIYAFDAFGQYSAGVSRSGRIEAVGIELCSNNVDDDADGQIDCADSNCATNPVCIIGVENCSNNSDDDADGQIDCADSNCTNNVLCLAVQYNEVCNNLYDDDADGQIDCADNDCVGHPACAVAVPGGVGGASATCSDNQDNDNDGKIDFGNDPGCTNANDSDESDSSVADFARLNVNDINFFAGNRHISLVQVDGRVNSLAGRDFAVAIPQSRLLSVPTDITLSIDSVPYTCGFNSSNNIHYCDLTLPNVGIHQAYLKINYGSEVVDTLLFNINCLPSGMVESSGESIADAEIVLLNENGAVVNLSEYGQTNPILTPASGLYGWMVLSGRYQVRVKKYGYYEQTVPIYATENNTVNVNINLIKTPPDLADVIDPNASLAENAFNVAKNLAEKSKVAGQLVVQAVSQAADNPQVEQAAEQVVAPTAVGVSAVSTVAFVPWLDLVALLRFLFLQPLLLIGRGKRKQWGMVYNSLSKTPIDLALVRLFDVATGKLIRSRVTDRNGRYAFIVAPGKYRLEAVKMNLIFPSALLSGVQSDGNRPDIYHGEEINVTNTNVLITANVPLDPIGETRTPKRILREKFWRKMQSAMSWLGLMFTLAALYVSPVWYVWVLAVVHFGLIFIFRRLARPRTAKGWGIVYDETTRKPIGRAVARLFDSQFNRLVATEITDKHGRYNFLAGDNKYYVAYEHNDYEPNKTEIIDLTGKEADAIAMDAKLKKKTLSTE